MFIRPTYAKVNLGAIRRNVAAIKAHLPQKTKFCAVVKADGYGHGSAMVSKAAIEAGAEWIGVAIPEEAAVLRGENIKAPILVLGPANLAQWRKAADLDVSMVVASQDCLKYALSVVKERGITMRLHLKVDTGMNRVGIKTLEETELILDAIQKDDRLVLEGFMTHFAASDEADKSYTVMQDKRFAEFIALVRARGLSPIIHASNSGAVLDCPELSYDMVRVGLAMYGCYTSETLTRDVVLEPAMALHTQISFIKDVEAGEKLSYGCTFTAPSKMRIATLPIGYADGYFRMLSNKGEVLVCGQRARVVGRVCMDQILVDITDIKDAQLHDNVVCFGRQNGTGIPVEEYAAHCGTVNYEVLCAISPRVPRLYFEG